MSAASSTMELQGGQQVGDRYVIDRMVASGGMGTVYVARQAPFDRKVALKIMHARHVSSEELKARFFREAEAMSQLTHPNTVTVFDYGEVDSICFIAMEFVDGDTVGAVLREKGSLRPEEAIPLAIQVAQSLGEAHSKGIIHRDLKPDNVLISNPSTGEKFARVADFGIAKIMDKEMQFTQVGNIVGTPYYMSPEQAYSGDVDPRSDIYALGCCLYEMLTGRPPFMGTTSVEVLMKHRTEPPPSLGPGYPPDLDSFIRKALSKEPEERHQDSSEFVRGLMACYVSSSWTGPPSALAETMDPTGLNESTEKGTPPPVLGGLEGNESGLGDRITLNSPVPGMLADSSPELPEPDSELRATEREYRRTEKNREANSSTSSKGRGWVAWVFLGSVAVALILAWGIWSSAETVEFDSSPRGAVVSVDGVSVGKTPIELELDPGRKTTASFSLTAHQPRTIEFEPGRLNRVYVEMERQQIEVKVRSPLEKLKVRINGDDFGALAAARVRSYTVERPSGPLRVVLESAGYEDYVVSIPVGSIETQIEISPAVEDFVER